MYKNTAKVPERPIHGQVYKYLYLWRFELSWLIYHMWLNNKLNSTIIPISCLLSALNLQRRLSALCSPVALFQVKRSELWRQTTLTSLIGFKMGVCMDEDFCVYVWKYRLEPSAKIWTVWFLTLLNRSRTEELTTIKQNFSALLSI